jgi:hypothetical protein
MGRYTRNKQKYDKLLYQLCEKCLRDKIKYIKKTVERKLKAHIEIIDADIDKKKKLILYILPEAPDKNGEKYEALENAYGKNNFDIITFNDIIGYIGHRTDSEEHENMADDLAKRFIKSLEAWGKQ